MICEMLLYVIKTFAPYFITRDHLKLINIDLMRLTGLSTKNLIYLVWSKIHMKDVLSCFQLEVYLIQRQ